MTGSSDSGYSISLQGGRMIYLGTFSKSLLPSLRISYMSAALRKQTVSAHSQWNLADFSKSGEWQKHMNRVRGLYRKKHAVLIESVCTELGDSAEILGENSGLHILLRIRRRVDHSRKRARCEGFPRLSFIQKHNRPLYLY